MIDSGKEEHHLQSEVESTNLSEIDTELVEDISEFLPQQSELHEKYIGILKQVLPHLGKDESKIVSTLIMLALKLEGIIGKELSEDDSKMVEILKDYILTTEKKETAMLVAQRISELSDKDQSTPS